MYVMYVNVVERGKVIYSQQGGPHFLNNFLHQENAEYCTGVENEAKRPVNTAKRGETIKKHIAV